MASFFRRAGAEIARIIRLLADPAAEASRMLVYSKDVLGITQLFARSSDGTVHQITPVTAGTGIATMQWTAIVDPALGSDVTGTFGDLEKPYATIQGALNDVPTPVDAASARRSYTILVAPGTYDEDLTVDLEGGKHVVIASWGPVNIGLFNGADWTPSVSRSIAITTTTNVVFDNIDASFSLQSLLPNDSGDETGNAQHAAIRVNGQLTATGVAVGTPGIDVTLNGVEFFGVAGAVIVNGATDISLRIRHSRIRGTITGTATVLQDASESRLQGLIDIQGYGRIHQCFINGMTIVGISPSSNTVQGFTDCRLQGVFTGPAGSYYFDHVTSYWFVTNGAAFAGGATRTLTEMVHPAPLNELWAQNDVPAATAGGVMQAQLSTNFDEVKMMRPGSIVGISSRLTEAVTGGLGALQVDATINGVIVPAAALQVSMGIGSTGGQTVAAPGVAPYVAGDLVGIKFTSPAGFTPTTTDLEAWLEIVEEIP